MELDSTQQGLMPAKTSFGYATYGANRVGLYCGLKPTTRCVGSGPTEVRPAQGYLFGTTK